MVVRPGKKSFLEFSHALFLSFSLHPGVLRHYFMGKKKLGQKLSNYSLPPTIGTCNLLFCIWYSISCGVVVAVFCSAIKQETLVSRSLCSFVSALYLDKEYLPSFSLYLAKNAKYCCFDLQLFPFFWAAPPVLQSELDKNNGASLIDKVGGRSIPRISYPRIPTRKKPGQKNAGVRREQNSPLLLRTMKAVDLNFLVSLSGKEE